MVAKSLHGHSKAEASPSRGLEMRYHGGYGKSNAGGATIIIDNPAPHHHSSSASSNPNPDRKYESYNETYTNASYQSPPSSSYSPAAISNSYNGNDNNYMYANIVITSINECGNLLAGTATDNTLSGWVCQNNGSTINLPRQIGGKAYRPS